MEAIPVQQPMLVEVTGKKLILLWNVNQCQHFLNKTQVSNYNF